jgi:thiol:disulfide interchange protein DsbA
MKNLVVALTVLLSFFLALPALAAEQVFEEDLHYFSVIPEQPGGEDGQIQVLEFFLYSCPHCYRLEPYIDGWLKHKPDNVTFDRVPAMFNRPEVVMYAKTYYALKLIGQEERLQGAIFEVLDQRKRRLGTQPEMERFLEEQGVDLEAYRKAMKSFAVQTQIRRAAVLAERFDITGVPALVVDGKYRTGGLEGGLMMKVTDYLVERAEKEKGAASE